MDKSESQTYNESVSYYEQQLRDFYESEESYEDPYENQQDPWASWEEDEEVYLRTHQNDYSISSEENYYG